MTGTTGSSSATLGPGAGMHHSRVGWAPTGPAVPLACPTVGTALIMAAERDPGQVVCYMFDDTDQLRTLSAGELLSASAGAAQVMRDRGLRSGDPVIISLDTGPDLLAAFFGCALIGAVPAIAEPALTARRTAAWAARISHLAAAAGAKLLITEGGHAEQALAAAQASGQCPAILMLRPPFQAGSGWAGQVPAGQADLAFIQFTSGTTGRPKGVTVSNGAAIANVTAIGQALRLDRGDLAVSWLPLHHDMGLVGCVLAPLLHGLPVALLRPLGFLLRPERWLWAIHYLRGTLSAAPNFAYQLCATRLPDAALAGLDLRCWRVACNGAEPVQAASLRRWQERMGRYGFRPQAMFPVYGLAEAVLAVTMPVPGSLPVVDTVSRGELASTGRVVPARSGAPGSIEVVSVGRPVPGYRVRVTDARGAGLPPRHEGRVLVAGPSLTGGYVGVAAGAAAVTGGWLDTGDLGYLAGGGLYITGRAKELIIKAGRNYRPHDLEAAAETVPGVRPRGVAAVGTRDELSGTDAITLAVETTERDPDQLRLMRVAIEAAVNSAAGARPDSVLFVRPGTLPRTTSGKLRRSQVAEMITAGTMPGTGQAAVPGAQPAGARP